MTNGFDGAAPYREGGPLQADWEAALVWRACAAFKAGMAAGAIVASSVFLVAALAGWCVGGAGMAPMPCPAVAGVSVDIDSGVVIVACPRPPAPVCVDDPQERVRELAAELGDGGAP